MYKLETNLKGYSMKNKYDPPLGWRRTEKIKPYFEVSSKASSDSGGRIYSALYATLKDGRTIEEAYQLDVKGYRTKGYTKYDIFKRNKDGKYMVKGRPPIY